MACDGRRSFFHVTFNIKLFEECPEIIDLGVVLDASENHSGFRNFCGRISDVLLKTSLIPGDAGTPVGLGVAEILGGPALRPSSPLSSGPILFLASAPTEWHGRHF